MRYAAAMAVLAAGLWPAPAHAVVLSEDPLEGDSVAVGATARSFNYYLDGPLLGSSAAITLTDLRTQAAIKRGDWLSISLDNSLNLTTSSLSLDSAGGALAFGQGRLPATWLPLDWTISGQSQLTLRDRIDWGYVRITHGPVSVTVGRQPVTFGRGALWTPEDLIDPFSPFQLDTEFKPGMDAARIDVTLGQVTFAMVGIAADPQQRGDLTIAPEASSAVQRIELSADTTRIGFMNGYVRGDLVGAVDLFVDLHGADLHGELAGFFVRDPARRPFGRKEFGRAVLGSTFQASSRVHATVEAYWNGSGTTDTADYEAALMSPRLQSGETYNVGVFYAGAILDIVAHPLVHIGAAAIVNLIDGSALIAPSIHVNASNNTVLIAGAFVSLGAKATEYALYPSLVHFDLKTYF